MSSMTGLNEIALYLWVGLDYYFFPLLILQLAGQAYWHDVCYKLVYPRVGN